MSKITAIFYLVKDKHGNKRSAIVENEANRIEISICTNSNQKYYFYTGLGSNLKSWCEENGLEYKEVRKDFEFEELWEE